MQPLIDLLKQVPDVIWSGLIASLLTLGGVLLSNRSNTTRLALQLQHDTSQKSLERTSAMRREVYLKVAEEIVKANMYLASLPQSDLTKLAPQRDLEGFSSAITRLQLVAEPRTALLALKLSAAYSELFFTLVGHVLPLASSKSDMQIADDGYNKSMNEVWRLIGERGKLLESGRPDEIAFAALSKALTFQQEQTEGYANERAAAAKAVHANTVTFQRHLFGQMKHLGAMQIPMLIEIRRDLGLLGDLSEVEEFMREQWQRLDAKLDDLLVSLEDD